ncbi:unnamed protein product [marine sediment metagenome]|uniref:DNA polymerase beta palm domain-containing protein n=1 Tax=marine sediment metagenome TaxID=412755 RepID=X0Z5Y1_9ZZZZ
MRSISDIRKKGEKFLTANQIVGLKYYDDLLEPIPREYITIFHGVLNYVLNETYGKSSYKLEIAGSYRRGKETSGDIDCLITSNKLTLKDIVDTNDNLWDEFTKNPRMTILQKKMTKAISKIEKREKSKINKK